METSSIQYKDPFVLSVFGVIFILIGLQARTASCAIKAHLRQSTQTAPRDALGRSNLRQPKPRGSFFA